MTSPAPDNANSSETEAEDELSLLLEKLMEDPTEKHLNQLCAEHPAFERDLKELWATLRIVDFAQQELNDSSMMQPESSVAKHPVEDYFEQAAPDSSKLQQRASYPQIENYELLEEIGRGGMGVVYKARQKNINRIVALKMISQGALASEEERSRFQLEAETAGRLHHPNIVPVYEVGEINNQPYFTMQLITGMNLAERLRSGPLSNRDAAALLMSVCGAIVVAHQQGILHRDLKPSNILLDQHGCPYITDFGLACRYEFNSNPQLSPGSDENQQRNRLTLTGAVLGTPGYVAPEQAARNRTRLNETTDVYGLGAVLYAMLTGVPPFQGANPLEVLMRVLEQEPVRPRILNPEIDRDLELIVLKCLQKPQDLRYQTALELQIDLKAYLHDEPIAARSSHVSQVIMRMFRETHHAPILENWGALWMWHSLVLLTICLVTNYLQFREVSTRFPYFWYLGVGLTLWVEIFWYAIELDR
ncbi:MAG: serine/threonine-protein kinase [Planctomycetaceae bacterium]